MQISENWLELAHDLTFDSHDGAWVIHRHGLQKHSIERRDHES
jgi:hypothetical protein